MSLVEVLVDKYEVSFYPNGGTNDHPLTSRIVQINLDKFEPYPVSSLLLKAAFQAHLEDVYPMFAPIVISEFKYNNIPTTAFAKTENTMKRPLPVLNTLTG